MRKYGYGYVYVCKFEQSSSICIQMIDLHKNRTIGKTMTNKIRPRCSAKIDYKAGNGEKDQLVKISKKL